MSDYPPTFVSCHYCDNEATEKKRVYEPEVGAIEVDVCADCARAIEDGILGE